MDERPLMVIFHDPPETIGEANALDGTFDAHNIIVVSFLHHCYAREDH